MMSLEAEQSLIKDKNNKEPKLQLWVTPEEEEKEQDRMERYETSHVRSTIGTSKEVSLDKSIF